MSEVLVICLGNPHAGDDGAALLAADSLAGCAIVRAGRPGPGLLDLLEREGPVVLVDVTQSGEAPGTLHHLDLGELTSAAVAGPNVSSHGFGPAQTLALGQALGRPMPPGHFIGIEGQRFEAGEELSPAVREGLPALVEAIRRSVEELS